MENSIGARSYATKRKAELFLKDSESGIDTIHSLQGVQHYWIWEDFQIVIKSDGTGLFYDFSGAEPDETRIASEVYECYNWPFREVNYYTFDYVGKP